MMYAGAILLFGILIIILATARLSWTFRMIDHRWYCGKQHRANVTCKPFLVSVVSVDKYLSPNSMREKLEKRALELEKRARDRRRDPSRGGSM